MNNYRINLRYKFSVDYWNKKDVKFSDLPRHCNIFIRNIRYKANDLGIKYLWFFYEPYLEITWLSDEAQAKELFEFAESLSSSRILDFIDWDSLEKRTPSDGVFGDWFCNNEREREFGAKRHSLCADFADLVEQYKYDIESGKGIGEQVKRTIHTICNPLGLNYKDEARICFSRGLICLLFCYFSFNKAVWIYTKIFRQKY
jgi:hypothetical protein